MPLNNTEPVILEVESILLTSAASIRLLKNVICQFRNQVCVFYTKFQFDNLLFTFITVL
jgi:hypothetical protein